MCDRRPAKMACHARFVIMIRIPWVVMTLRVTHCLTISRTSSVAMFLLELKQRQWAAVQHTNLKQHMCCLCYTRAEMLNCRSIINASANPFGAARTTNTVDPTWERQHPFQERENEYELRWCGEGSKSQITPRHDSITGALASTTELNAVCNICQNGDYVKLGPTTQTKLTRIKQKVWWCPDSPPKQSGLSVFLGYVCHCSWCGSAAKRMLIDESWSCPAIMWLLPRLSVRECIVSSSEETRKCYKACMYAC